MASTAINFSSGNLYAVATTAGVSNPTPVKFGILQEGSIEFDGTNKELYGNQQFPQDVARGAIKVMGKSKLAQIYSGMFNLFFGQTITTGAGVGVISGESDTVPGTSTYTITVAQAATFQTDLGVVYAATGIPLTRVASVSTAGQYSVNTSTGVYTFNSSDASAAVSISYEYGLTSGVNEIILTNQLMGNSPTFMAILACSYKGNFMNVHLNQAISEKLTIPTKNTDYTILEFDFQAYCDASNTLGKLTLSQ
jgi:hypothetical protein